MPDYRSHIQGPPHSREARGVVDAVSRGATGHFKGVRQEHREFHQSGVNGMAILRSTGKMMLAGWIIEKLSLREPLHRTLAYAAAGVGVGYIESVIKRRKENAADAGKPLRS